MSKVIFFKLVILISMTFFLSSPATAQNSNPDVRNAVVNNSEKVLKVKINPKKSLPITIVSQNSTVSEITAELTRQLKIPFALSRVIKNYKPNLNIPPSTLENVLQKLAPLGFIDYELPGRAPKPQIKGIYLLGYNEPIPVMADGTQISDTQTAIYQGNTETNIDGNSDPDLKVSYNDKKLSVSARKQLLILIAGRIAEELGVSLSLVNNPKEFASLEFANLSIEQAFRQLPPKIVLKYRTALDGSQFLLTEMILK